ncbi:uncharacterized protein J8A68_001823 [[Candida] subhashii]|uniref:PH-response regulator protein palH/RIM21 n=1 Tax=[Candida] subhashii TaxID=561895 RepID=A0A8J5QQ57_9ASCO|nr:uncharacterized protein J8A68_001823 [[Candida] subhashii]KAG7664661.1 hypothetical protein J8A68_001823 [[Candida] subhashii]
MGLIGFGNQTMLYLQEEDIPINCSVYSLTSGLLEIFHYPDLSINNNNSEWLNLTNQQFLPAYYITNCSIPDLIQLVNKSLVNDQTPDYVLTRYKQKDNGDTFVALLFVLCGTCVSGWMLSLLLYLSPKHKRKPWSAQLATLFYATVCTILLTRFTNAARLEFYNASLDIILLVDTLRNNSSFKSLNILSQVFTHLAWFQITLKISRQKFKKYNAIIGTTLILTCAAVQTFYQITFNNSNAIFNMSTSVYNWKIARCILEWLILIWFWANLLYYTTMMKNPTKVCYSKRLLPLALFNWFLFLFDLILSILYLSIFSQNWLVRTWIVIIPCMVDIILITTVWEWIFNIWVLEKRFELMGVLGRKISHDESMSLHSDKNDRILQKPTGGKFWNIFDKIRTTGSRSSLDTQEYTTTTDIVYDMKGISSSTVHDSDDTRILQHATVQLAANSLSPTPTTQTPHSIDVTPIEIGSVNRREDEREYDDEIVDGYDIWGHEEDEYEEDDDDDGYNKNNNNVHIPRRNVDDQMIIGSSRDHHHFDGNNNNTNNDNDNDNDDEDDDDAPPPFQPHPGYSMDDYWHDEKT